MQKLKCVSDGPNDRDRLIQRQRRHVVQHKSQRSTVEKFHDEIAEFPVVVQVNESDNIWVRNGSKDGVAQFELVKNSLIQCDSIRE